MSDAGPSQSITEELVDRSQHAVRQIDHALSDPRLAGIPALWLRTIRGTLTGDHEQPCGCVGGTDCRTFPADAKGSGMPS